MCFNYPGTVPVGHDGSPPHIADVQAAIQVELHSGAKVDLLFLQLYTRVLPGIGRHRFVQSYEFVTLSDEFALVTPQCLLSRVCLVPHIAHRHASSDFEDLEALERCKRPAFFALTLTHMWHSH